MNRSSYPRRYDLDALRATAMLLGIVLHAGLSFTPWPHQGWRNALACGRAWMMTFGFIGLFRKLCTRENKTIRYVSDSSYWLYVAHVPLIIGAQLAVRDWPLFSGIKYFLVLLAVTGLLLLIYQFLVRYTWLGRLLNGPRVRPTN